MTSAAERGVEISRLRITGGTEEDVNWSLRMPIEEPRRSWGCVTVTPHAAIDRTVSQLSRLFDSWFEADPDDFDAETSGHSADADQLYSALLLDDPLNLRSQSVDVPYAREAHRQIIVSAVSLLLATVKPHAAADATTRQQSAQQALRETLAFDVVDDLSREEAVALVEETYDRLDVPHEA